MPERHGVDSSETQSYLDHLQDLLAPLARLMIGKGVTYPMFDALLQRAYVQAAQEAFIADGEKPTASRLYMLTGIHRKKIAPLLEAPPAPDAEAVRPLSLRVRDRITSDPACLDRQGRIKPLPLSRREGGEHSFEAIVESVSKDVRPRAILDQWLQAGIAQLDGKGRLLVPIMTTARHAVPGERAARLHAMLRPVVQVMADDGLGRLRTGGWIVAEVAGLSHAAAVELAAENLKDMRELVGRFNRRAEQRTRADARAGRGGNCSVHAGGFQWVEASPPGPPDVEGSRTRQPAAAGRGAKVRPLPKPKPKPKAEPKPEPKPAPKPKAKPGAKPVSAGSRPPRRV